MQAENPMLLGSMGPGQPIYDHGLQAQPFHAAEPEHFPEATFDLLSNPLNPHIDQAIATLEDLGVTADMFHLRQLPLEYLDQAQQIAYLGHEWDHIQGEQGFLHLAKRNCYDHSSQLPVMDSHYLQNNYYTETPHILP
jgi:hypothetical protein